MHEKLPAQLIILNSNESGLTGNLSDADKKVTNSFEKKIQFCLFHEVPGGESSRRWALVPGEGESRAASQISTNVKLRLNEDLHDKCPPAERRASDGEE